MSDEPVGTVVEDERDRAEIMRYEPNSYDGFNEPCEVVYGTVTRDDETTEFRIILRIQHRPFGTDTEAQFVAECVAYEWDPVRETTGTELYHYSTANHRITWEAMLEDVLDEANKLFRER